MKRNIIFCMFIFCTTVCYAQSDLKQLEWLKGEWNRSNAKSGSSGIEKWIIKSPTEMQGWGMVMRGTDTSFIENLKIAVKNNTIYYMADVPENKGVVRFTLTRSSDNEFVFENPEHDFPKKIVYTREGNKLTVVISGNGKAMDFLFEKKL